MILALLNLGFPPFYRPLQLNCDLLPGQTSIELPVTLLPTTHTSIKHPFQEETRYRGLYLVPH